MAWPPSIGLIRHPASLRRKNSRALSHTSGQKENTVDALRAFFTPEARSATDG